MRKIENSDNLHFLTGSESGLLPVLLFEVSCGFPSPAENYVEERIDILREIVKHPLTT